MPMSTGGNFAIQGIKSCRDKRLRYTIVPLSSIPTACNRRFAISIPRTCISCFIGLASCGFMGSRIVNSLWLIEVDPHRGGSISLRPVVFEPDLQGFVTVTVVVMAQREAALMRG